MDLIEAKPEVAHREAAQSLSASTGASSTLAVIVPWLLATWLLMVPIRAQVMGYGWYWLTSPVQAFWPAVAGSWLDLLYLVGLATAFLVLTALAPGKRGRRIAVATYPVACILSLLFGVANIDIVSMVGHPLTYSWLYYSGFLRSYDAQQALAAGLTWKVVLGAGFCIVALVALAWSFRRLVAWLNRYARSRRWSIVTAVLLTMTYLATSAYSMREFHQPCLQNPVVALAASMFEGSDNRLFSVETSASNADYQAIAAATPPLAHTTASPIRNVLVIVLESVGAQYLPAYGGERPITPQLDQYRSQSRIYRNIYAHAPATNKSLVSLLCSMYPWPTYRFLTQEHPDAKVTSISDTLHAQGYRTAFISAADLRFGDAEGFLANHKFDTVLDHRTINDVAFKSNEPGHLDGTSDSAVCRTLSNWIEADAARPFFAVLWTNQTHYPYFVRTQPAADQPRDLRTTLSDRYYQAISETDAAIGQLLGDLKRLELDEQTLVVIVGDHGEAFGQHGRFGHGNTVRELKGSGGGFGHGTALYEENIHVPLILINPKLFSGQEDTTIGGLVDVAPTILDLLQLPAANGWQGRSLGRPVDRERVFFAASWSGAVFGYRQGNRKYLFDAMANSYKVFDLERDPNELKDIAAECSPGELDEVYQHLAAWVQYQEKLVQSVAGKP